MEQLRRFASVPLASRYYREALEHMGDMRRAYRSGILDKRFIERIMLLSLSQRLQNVQLCPYPDGARERHECAGDQVHAQR